MSETIKRVAGLGFELPNRPERYNDFFGIHEVVEDELLISAAELLKDSHDRYIIRIQPKSTQGRRRFSYFHELCHVWFDLAVEARKPYLTPQEFIEISKTQRDEEQLCHLGASEFLFPRKLFRDHMAMFVPSLDAVWDTARKFGSSFEAAATHVGEGFRGDIWIQKWTHRDGVFEYVNLCHSFAFHDYHEELRRSPRPMDVVLRAHGRHSAESSRYRLRLRGTDTKVTAEAAWRDYGNGGNVLCVIYPDTL